MINLVPLVILVYCAYKIYKQHKVIKAQTNLIVILQVSQDIMEQRWKAE